MSKQTCGAASRIRSSGELVDEDKTEQCGNVTSTEIMQPAKTTLGCRPGNDRDVDVCRLI
jgi:hypothetical protein